MEITNSQILQNITDLRSEIKESNLLLEKIIKLDNVDLNSIITLKNKIHNNIIEMKKDQYLIQNRNFNNNIEYNNKLICIFELIKIKEKFIMMIDLNSIIINTTSSQEKILHLSLENYQEVNEYKSEIFKIQKLLNTFNNQLFTKETI